MKRLILFLAVLIATPAFALTIDVNDLENGDVAIEYSDANAQNLPRAFGLVVTVDKGAFVSAIGGYKTDGESTSGNPGFGIYPGSILIDVNIPANTVYGDPMADACDPGSGDGTTVVVLEFGSLYDGDGNAPGTSGTLCVLTIDLNGATDVNVAVADEDTYRGGVILEDGTEVDLGDNAILGDAPPLTCWDAAACPGQANGDANCDGTVNLDDLIALKKAWGKTTSDPIGTGIGEYNCCADFNRAGVSEDVINLDDLIALKIGWGGSHPGSTLNQTCPAGH